jgi:hypothetical protein
MHNSAPTGQRGAQSQPRRQLIPCPGVHADFATLAAFAVAHEDRAAGGIKVALGERECLADPKARAPEHDDQAAHSEPFGVIAGAAHDRDDLLDRRWVGRVAQPLDTWRATVVIARQRRRLTATTGSVQQYGLH